MLVVNANDPPASGLRCRQINQGDMDAVATLLAQGFPAHDRRFWLNALARLTRHESPPGLPKYGYVLESQGAVVGAILVICSTIPANDTVVTRCNLSSWYVEPRFRAYAPLLVSQALRHKNVTYTNVSPAPHTRPIIEAQGFSCYSEGIFVAIPALQGPIGDRAIEVFEARRRPQVDFDPFDQKILQQHAANGCISLWCATSEKAYPFVFRPRLVKTLRTLCATDLLPRHRRSCLLRRAGGTGACMAWPAAGPDRRQRPHTRADRVVQPRADAEIF